MATRQQNLIWAVTALLICLNAQAKVEALAAENDGSLDTMWREPTDAVGASEGTKTSEQASNLAGICSIPSFLESGIIAVGAWPKVGPFKRDTQNSYNFGDSQANRLSLSVSQDKIIGAQLDLVGLKGDSDVATKVQVTTDFLLEGLGVPPTKINDFNLKIEKELAQHKEIFTAPLNLAIDRYLISLLPISSSLEAVRVRVSESSASNIAWPNADKESIEAIVSAGRENNQANASKFQQQGSESVPENDRHGISSVIASAAGSKSNKLTQSNSTDFTKAPTTSAKSELLKNEFLKLIENWQTVKKKAVREANTKDLSTVLAGKALLRQTEAINWLANNHKHYDMNPKGASVERLTEITPDKNYQVFALVRESTRYIDEKLGQVLKESDDTYHVIYTLEKTAGLWFIVDSTIIKSASPAKAQSQH